MKNKLNYILTLIFLFLTISSMAQRASFNLEDVKAKLRADKVAYLTTRMDLTPDEAEKFWPVYNEFDGKRVDIQMAYFSLERKTIDSRGETPSDEEITNFIKVDFTKKQEEEELNSKYYEKFLKILPPKKVLTLYKAERDYYRYLDMKSRGDRNNFNMNR